MRIIIDGQRIPVNARTSKDILLTLRSMGRMLNWGMFYDATKEIVYINTKSSSPPVPPPDRQSIGDTIESTRLVGKTICIDPGHGGSDSGVMGSTGTKERDNTLAIALLLRDRLEKNGACIVMTRDSDKDVSFPDSAADEELGARVDAANEAGADIFLSIHNDSLPTVPPPAPPPITTVTPNRSGWPALFKNAWWKNWEQRIAAPASPVFM